MGKEYPYPRLQEDGYEFQVVEQGDDRAQEFLASRLPDEDRRFSVGVGDTVKLVFLYRDPVEKNGQTFTAEHMWVEVTELCGGFIRGRLDSVPQYTNLIGEDQEVRFHPKHIVNIWQESKDPEDKRLGDQAHLVIVEHPGVLVPIRFKDI